MQGYSQCALPIFVSTSFTVTKTSELYSVFDINIGHVCMHSLSSCLCYSYLACVTFQGFQSPANPQDCVLANNYYANEDPIILMTHIISKLEY